MKHVLFACAAMLVASAPALSAFADDLQDGESRAILATPASKPMEFTIDGRIWRCDAAVCGAQPTAQAEPQRIASECHNAAMHIGAVTSYQTGRKVLTPAQITDCNTNLANR
jgi:hypothetical protein